MCASCQVNRVDVVADGRTVVRGIVVPEHRHVLALAKRHLQHQRDAGALRAAILADVAVGGVRRWR
jgi:hypothetical protein